MGYIVNASRSRTTTATYSYYTHFDRVPARCSGWNYPETTDIFSLSITNVSLNLYVFSSFLPNLMPPLPIFLPGLRRLSYRSQNILTCFSGFKQHTIFFFVIMMFFANKIYGHDPSKWIFMSRIGIDVSNDISTYQRFSSLSQLKSG